MDIPRTIWQSSNIRLMLHQTYFRVAKITMEASEAQEKYEDTLEVCDSRLSAIYIIGDIIGGSLWSTDLTILP